MFEKCVLKGGHDVTGELEEKVMMKTFCEVVKETKYCVERKRQF